MIDSMIDGAGTGALGGVKRDEMADREIAGGVVAGVDIGGTKISIAVAHASGAIIAARRVPTDAEAGPLRALDNIESVLNDLISETSSPLLAIAVGSPAPIDVDRGLILSPSNLRSWVEFPVVELLEERFGVPVVLENDANAAAVGEHIYGAGRGCENVLYVTVSTGVGGGLIINGQLYRGAATGAGEIGHTVVQPDGHLCNCGSIGCLETVSSGHHLARRAKERLRAGERSMIREMVTDLEEVTARVVVDAVTSGDRLAEDVWDEACRFLAIGIANAITLIAPELVIVGGGVASAGDLLFEPLREQVPGFVSMVPAEVIRIVPAQLGTESGVHGAVALARRTVLSASN